MIQSHIFVSGFVQGVGYRAFVVHLARKMGLCGWTRNLSDGRVEILVQGNKNTLEKFTKKLWDGSMLSEVTHVTVEHVKFQEKHEGFQKLSSI